MKHTYFLLVLCFAACGNVAFAQLKTIKSIRVTDIDSPYVEISVSNDRDTDDDDYLLDSLLKITNKKGDAIKIEEILEGSEVDMKYRELDEKKIVTEIRLLTVPDNEKMDYKAVFEGLTDSVAMVGGRKVKLAQNGVIKGKGKTTLKDFSDTAIKRGCYMEIEGILQSDGIIYAKEIVVSENHRTKDDDRLLSFIKTRFNGEGLQKFSEEGKKNANVTSGTATKKYKGTLKAGNMTYTLVDDINIQGYINDIGFRLLPEYVNDEAWQKENPDVSFEFYVIEDPVPNAFALPNGKVMVHTGLLQVAENEAQIAFVMSHEISHVLYKHGTARFVRSENNKKVTNAVDKTVGTAKKLITGLTGVRVRKLTTAETASAASSMMGGSVVTQAAVAVGTVVIKNIYEKLSQDEFSNLFSKKKEKEADIVGLYYTRNAGYDIREVPKFWSRMMQVNSDPTYVDHLGSNLKKSLAKNLTLNGSADLSTQLMTVGTETLLNGSLETVYISHPLSKKRKKATYNALTSIYRSDNFTRTVVGKQEYQAYLRRLK